MEHLGSPDQPVGPMPELVWLRKIIVERALTRGDYLLSGGAHSDYYIDKFRLFSDPHVYVQAVGASVEPAEPSSYRLTMMASLR